MSRRVLAESKTPVSHQLTPQLLSIVLFAGYKNARAADAPDGSPSPAPAAGPTKITPRQNDGSGNGYPGAAPLPRSVGSRNAAAGAGALGVAGLYLLLLLAAALV